MNRTLWEALTMLYITGGVSLLAGLLRATEESCIRSDGSGPDSP